MAKPSKKSARHGHILALLDANPLLRVNELAAELDVSSETVRRDLNELEETGRLARTYGGAVRSHAFEPALTERLKLYVPQRQRIARKAMDLLGETDVVFIGGGATTLHFARALRSIKRRLNVITPAFAIANELASNALIQVMALPGIVEPKERLVCGTETLAAIRKYRPPLAVIGASGVSAEGVSEALMNAAEVYAAIIANSEETLVLADASKYNHRALQIITPWAPHCTLVCDKAPDGVLAAAMRDGGAQCVVVNMDDVTLNACGSKG